MFELGPDPFQHFWGYICAAVDYLFRPFVRDFGIVNLHAVRCMANRNELKKHTFLSQSGLSVMVFIILIMSISRFVLRNLYIYNLASSRMEP